MKDVIFQGSRNRPPSGMAEVVMHLVRDEVVEAEPDIEDIDSTLEELDDRAVTLGLPEADAESVENGHPGCAGRSSCPFRGVLNRPCCSGISKIHKRHWRRRNLALEFQPGSSLGNATALPVW